MPVVSSPPRHLLAVALLALPLTACNPSPYGTCPTGELDAAALPALGVQRLNPEAMRRDCFRFLVEAEGDPAYRVVPDAATWNELLDRCWMFSMDPDPPSVDWATQEVIGVSASGWCPAASWIISERLSCETGELAVVMGWEHDWCFCDYGGDLVAAYIAPKGLIRSLTLEIPSVDVCEDATCNCFGTTYDGCTGCPMF